jgi:hypothetical protein
MGETPFVLGIFGVTLCEAFCGIVYDVLLHMPVYDAFSGTVKGVF